MTYFRQRGIRDDIVRKFQLGYSTTAHDALAQEALRKGYKKEFLIKTGHKSCTLFPEAGRYAEMHLAEKYRLRMDFLLVHDRAPLRRISAVRFR